MHRINLRGPWSLEQSSGESGKSLISLTRNFNSPTNVAASNVAIHLKLSLCSPPTMVYLNGCGLTMAPEVHLNAVGIGDYDVKSSLQPHNCLTVQWLDRICDIETKNVRLGTEQTNRWLADAWLEIVES